MESFVFLNFYVSLKMFDALKGMKPQADMSSGVPARFSLMAGCRYLKSAGK